MPVKTMKKYLADIRKLTADEILDRDGNLSEFMEFIRQAESYKKAHSRKCALLFSYDDGHLNTVIGDYSRLDNVLLIQHFDKPFLSLIKKDTQKAIDYLAERLDKKLEENRIQ